MLIGQTSPVVVPTVRGISVQINRKFIKTQLLPDSDSQEICSLIQVKRESCSPLISQAECLLIPFSNYSAAGSFVDGTHVVSGSNLKYPTARGGWDVVSGTETRGQAQKHAKWLRRWLSALCIGSEVRGRLMSVLSITLLPHRFRMQCEIQSLDLVWSLGVFLYISPWLMYKK